MIDGHSKSPRGNILVVEDVPALRRLVCDILRDQGYQVRAEANGRRGLKAALANPPDLVLLDINMPEMDGYEVCHRLKADIGTQNIPVIFISALGETQEKVRAFEEGGVDFITKPFQVGEVLVRVENHLQLQNLRRELQQANGELEKRVEERTLALLKNVTKLENTLNSAIFAMAKIVEIRDPYTAGHQQRVAQLTRAIAEVLGLPSDQVDQSHMTAVIHDIGKITVPAEILSKPGRLTELEFALLKTHTQIGADIVKMIEFPWPVDQIILQHHERMDGAGYPAQLAGDEILLEARIIGVCDVVEAMSSHRPYRPALGIDLALEEITQNAGRLYDKDVVDACLQVFGEQEFQFDHQGMGLGS